MTTRGRRVGLLNLPWAGHWSALAAAPLEVPTVPELRATLARLAEADPGHPLMCRLDASRRRWMSVPAADRAAQLEVLVRQGEPLDLQAIGDYIDRYRPPLESEFPFAVVLGASSIVVYLAHLYGDARTFTNTILHLLRADDAALRQLEPRAGLRLPLTAVVRQSRSTYRSWARRGAAPLLSLTRRATEPSPVEPSRAPSTRSVVGPAAAGTVLDNASLRGLTRWRNEHAPGVSITAVLASRTYTALVNAGVPVAGKGFYSLFDIRAYLPEEAAAVPGNLAKSVYIDADLGDPAAIDEALREVMSSRRALAALVAGALASGVPLRSGSGHGGDAGPAHRPEVALTFNSMPSLPGLDRLPWVGTGPRRYVGVGYPTGPVGISVFAVRFRDRMELNAGFDLSLAAPETIEAALVAVGDVAGRGPSAPRPPDAG